MLQYAGDGKFSLEEDFWSLPEGTETLKQYFRACKQFDPEHAQKRTRTTGKWSGLDPRRGDLPKVAALKGSTPESRHLSGKDI